METTQLIDRSHDMRRNGLLGLRAGADARAVLVLPALCALVYPFLSSLLSSVLVLAHGSPSPDGFALWVGVIASLILAAAVMLVSFAVARTLSESRDNTPLNQYARGVAHLAFATPSLLVGFANVANVARSPGTVPIAWSIFWILVAAAVLVIPRSPPQPHKKPIGMSAETRRRLALAHGISACAILVLFVVPHILNHLVGFWNGAAHLGTMNVMRLLYRDDVVQPILLALIGFQIVSGTALVRRRMRLPGDFIGTVQTMTGVYVGIYFLAHMTAVFAARYAGTDTNWNWLTNNGHVMLSSLSTLRLIAHYWVGPIAILVHVGYGIRMVLLERQVSPVVANRLLRGLVGGGVVIATVILVALLNVHLS